MRCNMRPPGGGCRRPATSRGTDAGRGAPPNVSEQRWPAAKRPQTPTAPADPEADGADEPVAPCPDPARAGGDEAQSAEETTRIEAGRPRAGGRPGLDPRWRLRRPWNEGCRTPPERALERTATWARVDPRGHRGGRDRIREPRPGTSTPGGTARTRIASPDAFPFTPAHLGVTSRLEKLGDGREPFSADTRRAPTKCAERRFAKVPKPTNARAPCGDRDETAAGEVPREDGAALGACPPGRPAARRGSPVGYPGTPGPCVPGGDPRGGERRASKVGSVHLASAARRRSEV